MYDIGNSIQLMYLINTPIRMYKKKKHLFGCFSTQIMIILTIGQISISFNNIMITKKHAEMNEGVYISSVKDI